MSANKESWKEVEAEGPGGGGGADAGAAADADKPGKAAEGSKAKGPSSSGGPKAKVDDENEFADFLWMENYEEVDAELSEEVLQELREEQMIHMYCDLFEASLNEDGTPGPNTANLHVVDDHHLINQMPNFNNSAVDSDLESVSRQLNRVSLGSRLNPNAAEFIPKGFTDVYHN